MNTVNTLKKMILEFQISSQKMDLTFPIPSSITSNAAAAPATQKQMEMVVPKTFPAVFGPERAEDTAPIVESDEETDDDMGPLIDSGDEGDYPRVDCSRRDSSSDE